METKISLITVCSNRLHHLKQTLPENIRDNKNYTNLEFLVLDYNSSDGLEAWMSLNFGDLIESGRLKYFRTLEERTYHQSHSRNLGFSLATGDVLCNINADQFTGASFANYVDEAFSTHDDIVITPIDFFGTRQNYYVPGDLFGLCCVKKIDFHKVGGFDESMNNYGFEDVDFINRLEMTGLNRLFPEDISRFRYIKHGKEERYPLSAILQKIKRLFVTYLEPARSEWIVLDVDSRYESFLLVDKYALEAAFFVNAYTANSNRYQLYLEYAELPTGVWSQPNSQVIALKPDKSLMNIDFISANNMEFIDSSTGKSYVEVLDRSTITKIIDFKYTFHSRFIMEKNVRNRLIVPNKHNYGKGGVRALIN